MFKIQVSSFHWTESLSLRRTRITVIRTNNNRTVFVFRDLNVKRVEAVNYRNETVKSGVKLVNFSSNAFFTEFQLDNVENLPQSARIAPVIQHRNDNKRSHSSHYLHSVFQVIG